MKQIKWNDIKIGEFFVSGKSAYLKTFSDYCISRTFQTYHASDFAYTDLSTSKKLQEDKWNWEYESEYDVILTANYKIQSPHFLKHIEVTHGSILSNEHSKGVNTLLGSLITNPYVHYNFEHDTLYKITISANADNELKLEVA